MKKTKIRKLHKCIYCHTPIIEGSDPQPPFYCQTSCKENTSDALKVFFDELGSDLGCGG